MGIRGRMHFFVHATRPDHSSGAQVHRLPATQDAGYRQAALELSALEFARLWYHCEIYTINPY